MPHKEIIDAFIGLVRLGIGVNVGGFSGIDSQSQWDALQTLATKQGVSAIVVDGLEKLPLNQKPPKPMLLQWIGEVLQDESGNAVQLKTAADMALFFKENIIRTYVLKGAVVAECYPKSEHRSSSDMDCFLLPDEGDFDAWDLGNSLMKSNGCEVITNFYKNSTFYLPGLMVENHKFMTPFRGNKKLAGFERMLQALIRSDNGNDRIEGSWLYRPPVMFTALFLVEHAYSHFLHEGLTWRHVLDWMMFSCKHHSEIDWTAFMAYVDEFGFRKFYNSYERLGQYLLGEIQEEELTEKDKMMLADVWAPLDLHESKEGIKGKFALAGNTWRAMWKYRHFADISMVHALWIQVMGFLFIKNPTLD